MNPDTNTDAAGRLASSRLEAFAISVLLLGLAVAQPLYDVLGDHAEFFVTYGVGRPGILAFAFVLSIALPATLAAIPTVARAVLPRSGRVLESALQFGAWTLIFLPVIVRFGMEGYLAIALALLAASLALYGSVKLHPFRLTLRYLTPAILLFPLFFLVDPRVSTLVRGGDSPDTAAKPDSLPPTNIVFIMFDEFPLASIMTPDLLIDRARYPNFARLADRSTWFRSATTPSEITTHAVPAALSGLDPGDDAGVLPISSNFPRTLFSLVAGSHEVISRETSTLLCPESVCAAGRTVRDPLQVARAMASDILIVFGHIVTPRPWSARLPSISHAWSGFANADRGRDHLGATAKPGEQDTNQRIKRQERWGDRDEDFGKFIDAIRNDGAPRLYYVHSLLPHSAWRYLPDGRQYISDEARVNFGLRSDDDPERVFFHEWYPDALMVNQAWQRHLLQVGFVDYLLGRVLDRLVEENLFDDALLVVAGDHGASFLPGRSRRSVDATTQSDIAAVPLFIKFPEQASGIIDDRPATLTDIMPTVVSALEIDIDWAFDGRDLTAASRDASEPVRVRDSAGRLFEFDRDGFRTHLQDTVVRKVELFGEGSFESLFRLGPHAELIGRAPAELGITDAARGLLLIDNALLYREIDTSTDFVPLQLWGQWHDHASSAREVPIAVAVNGTVHGTTRTYLDGEFATWFSVVLPPNAFADGANKLDFFEIRRDAGQTTLAPLPREEPDQPLLERSADGVNVVFSSGERYALVDAPWPGEVETYLDRSKRLIFLQGSFARAPDDRVMLVTFRNDWGIDARAFDGAADPEGGTTHRFRLPFVFAGDESTSRIEVRTLIVDRKRGTAHELTYPPMCSPRWRFAPPAAWHIGSCDELDSILPPVTDGFYRAVLQFDDERIRRHLDDGWHVESSGIAWSVQNEARMTLPLPPSGEDWTFRVRLKPFLVPGKLERQRLIVREGQDTLGEWEFTELRFTDIEWQVSRTGPGDDEERVLRFILPDAVSPFSLDSGQDKRALGVAINRVIIER